MCEAPDVTASCRRDSRQRLGHRRLERRQSLGHVLAEMDAQRAPVAVDQHLEVATRLGGLDHPERVALSGGYTQKEANERLRRNQGVVASFSRALVEGLSAQQSDAAFNAVLDQSIQNIFEASGT